MTFQWLSTPWQDPRSRLVTDVMDMYTIMGDRIALQYGGSEAHRKVRRRHGGESLMAPEDEMSGGGGVQLAVAVA